MNITPHAPILPMPTVVNPPTENLRRENHQREVIAQVAAASHSAAEKGVASDKERARTPAQTHENVDFANLRKQTEQAAHSIGEQQGDSEHQQSEQEQGNFSKAEQNQEDAEQESQESQAANDKNTRAEEKLLTELQQRDQEVRAHERAHASLGGSATGSPSYTFKVGPDGKKYAVGGEVSVDLSTVAGDPQATISKMQKVHAAALAPVSPSIQDTRVAASATQIILQAQSELLIQQDAEAAQAKASSENSVKQNASFNDSNSNTTADDFDQLINQTLDAQEKLVPSSSEQTLKHEVTSEIETELAQQSLEVSQRAQRIESFYQKITLAYEKPDNFQFELTA